MKVKARTNGNIVDLPDETATPLIAAGIYDAVEPVESVDEAPPPTPRKKAPK